MRKQIAAANWKMNLTIQEAEKLVIELIEKLPTLQINQEVVVGVPFPYLTMVKGIIANKANVFVAAQNCYTKNAGAYTGETSVPMLKSIGVEYVIIGHSERREYFHECHKMLTEKVERCFEHGLKPIFCCGEPLKIREAGLQNQYVETQLKESLFQFSAEQLKGFIIAYEPIWAIGTGKTASSEQAQEMHAHIRSVFQGQYGADIADTISILYGGSVKAANANEIFGKPDVDGGLVGGASLVVSEFVPIIEGLSS